MFRFWSSDSRGSEKTVDPSLPLTNSDPSTLATVPDFRATASPASKEKDRPLKRRRPSLPKDLRRPDSDDILPAKRIKSHVALLSPQSPSPECEAWPVGEALRDDPVTHDTEERARDAIQYQFGLEILLKHDELRLINQELAKCQAALEQLRRCHLIPYPVSCPTPAQMLEISSGQGPALQSRPGEPVPRWAPPFGVVDGPYARHYARWLIPDPMFDGMQPEPQGSLQVGRTKNVTAEARATRNGISDGVTLSKGGRPVRGAGGQKLHSLSSGYPQPKDKQAPCILKRSDGQTVKLVCLDCHRWDFSSTQGFINHCRIAHRRDFKSHEEAAVHCGHPIDLDDARGPPADEKPPAPSSGLVHSFARNEPLTDQQAYAALRSRISASLGLYRAGKLPDVKSIPGAPTKPPPPNSKVKSQSGSFVGASTTPYLSRMLQSKNFDGNLKEHVEDAKTKVDLDEAFAPSDDSEDGGDNPGTSDGASSPAKPPAMTARTPAVMRVPARTVVSPVPLPSIPRPASSKGRGQHLPFGAVPETPENEEESPVPYEDEMDIDLSPNTMVSNNAPSLVSDDGEYDDSDDGSSSETSESIETESISDVAEINIDEDNDGQDHDATPRPIRHHRSSSGTTVKLRKDEGKHVTFVTPITSNKGKTKGRRKHKV